jgi:hypothetical protein
MWEAERYDWSKLRAQGTAIGVPAALEAIQKASTAEEAEEAYWRIDNTVIVQGALHESAAATAACAITLLPRCLPPGRAFLLELLMQIATGEPAPDETPIAGDSVGQLCSREIRSGYALYLDLLERGDDDERGWCADLVGTCVRHDQSLLNRTAWYLTRAQEVVQNPGVKKLLEKWEQELRTMLPKDGD